MMMKKIVIGLSAVTLFLLMSSCYRHTRCATYGGTHAKARAKRSVTVPSGTFHMGQADEDVQGYRTSQLDYKQDKWNTEGYVPIEENNWKYVSSAPLSTFSIDVDNASYSNVRSMLSIGNLPPKDAIRIEEFINYFDYTYQAPAKDSIYAIHTEYAACPWDSTHKLLLIGLNSEKVSHEELLPVNLTYLIDVSGSMEDHHKLPLLIRTMKLYVKQMRPQDHVSIVVYAGAVGEVLPPTSGNEKTKIVDALSRLKAGGSTAGGEGIKLAYKHAKQHASSNSINRIILATDGDFNIGPSSDAAMKRLIESHRDQGIDITVLGYGRGNYQDSKMELIADHGNGNYFYIDSFEESRNVMVTNLSSTLMTVAKDVKYQIEFNPVNVAKYRLIAYENRKLENEDFNDDKKDAGDLGAGHQVTVLYEIVESNNQEVEKNIDSLKYQQMIIRPGANHEIGLIKSRYKLPTSAKSILREHPVLMNISKPTQNFILASAVAGFGFKLRGEQSYGNMSYATLIDMVEQTRIHDPEGRRSELIQLMKKAKTLAR